jgi:hypothetical protein
MEVLCDIIARVRFLDLTVLRLVALMRTDVSEECITSIIKVRIEEH